MGKFHQFLTELSACNILVLRFKMITWVKLMDSHQLGICIATVEIWFGIAVGQISIFWQLSARNTSVFSFPEYNLSKYQWIFTKLGIVTAVVEIWFGIANRKISTIFEFCARDTSIFLFQDNNFSKYRWIFTQPDICMCFDIVKIWFGIAIGYISSTFDRVISPWHDIGRVLSFHVFISQGRVSLIWNALYYLDLVHTMHTISVQAKFVAYTTFWIFSLAHEMSRLNCFLWNIKK